MARELWWTSQEFSLAGIIITMPIHTHITRGLNNKPLVAAILRRLTP
jgi:hypothetical protein